MSTLTAPAQTSTYTWSIDAFHSEIHFKVKHLVITTVTGKFKNFSGKVETANEDFSNAKIEFSADVNSIDTGAEARDTHLKSPDFFDAEKYPELSFKSKSFTKKGDDYILTGDLTIRDITRTVELSVEFAGITKDPFYGKTKAGFELNGKINRKDFGLVWGALTETGGAVVSDEVKLHANIQVDRIDA
jgi:polyisoprenoid-binding protein YceI